MANKQEKIIYKSFEELQSELFPNLLEKENTNQAKLDAEEFGSCLANSAIDQLLNTNS